MKEKGKDKKKPIIGITCGDLCGIGLEVTLKALADPRVLRQFVPVILASGKLISFYRKLLKMDDFSYFHTNDIAKLNPKKVNVLNIWEEPVEVHPGQPSQDLAQYTVKSLEVGVDLLKKHQLSALVTSPLNKSVVHSDAFSFPGHTEFFTQAFDAPDSLMFMVHENVRVGVATGHIPLSQVPSALNVDLILSKSKLMLDSLKKDFGINKPKLAILGLNPHAGDNGLLGSEDQEIVTPAIQELKNGGHLAMGPFPADGFFGAGHYANFDGVLAMYHDQGLIPFKHIAFGGGVNFTAGLPIIRTSPDHGTAYSLAGKNVSNHSSMSAALFAALDIHRQREA